MLSRCLKYGTALRSKKWNSHKALSLDRALYLRLGHTKILHWSHFLWFKNIKPPVQMKLQPDFKIISIDLPMQSSVGWSTSDPKAVSNISTREVGLPTTPSLAAVRVKFLPDSQGLCWCELAPPLTGSPMLGDTVTNNTSFFFYLT